MKKSIKRSLTAMHTIRKITSLRIIILLTVMFAMVSNTSQAQLSLTNGAPNAFIDFSNTMPGTVGTSAPSTAFTSTGLRPNPNGVTYPGRLNSNAWSFLGWSDGDQNYGTIITNGDLARLGINVPVSTGGIYAYTGAPASAANPTLMIQPGGGDFDPGSLTLRVVNNGTTIITSLDISYNLFVRNNESRGDSLNFSYSSDNFVNSDNLVPSMDYGSTVAPDALGWVQVGTSPSRSATISTGVYIPPGQMIYLRWSHLSTVGSTGSRDELGLDDINITATYSGPCTGPSTQAVINSFSGILSSQMNVDYTRGNGTGGVLLVASTNATLSSDPISGVNYSSNSNYGNGDPIGGGFVVYNGTANGVGAAATTIVTGLPPSTTIYFFIFEYGVTVPCYRVPGNTASQATDIGTATAPTDYFRSRQPGSWNNSFNWESSSDNITWITATAKPSFFSSGILIQSPHTITITSNETAKLLTVASGATLTYNNTAGGGWDLDIAADASDIDFKISGTYVIFGKMPTLAVGATVQVYNGGIVRADGNAVGTSSDDFARLTTVLFATGAVFQWNTTLSFQSASATYFPSAAATDIATFRVSQFMGFGIGAGTSTTINGLLEVNANLNLGNTGTKTFRNGIIGTANLSQTAASNIVIDGATAVIGGTGIINLVAGGTLTVAPSSVTTLLNNKTFNFGAIVVDGTLLCAANIVSGSSNFTLSNAATLGIGHPNGITPLASGAVGNIQVAATRSYGTAANYLYNSAVANQVTGSGLPSTIVAGGSLNISNTGGAGNNTVTLTTNNTTTPILNLINGLFEAGTAQFLKIAATGTVNSVSPGGNQGQSPAAGTINFVGSGTVNPLTGLSLTNVRINGGVLMGGGNTAIKGIFEIAINGFVNGGTAPTYSSSPASTLLYSCGCNYGAGNEWYPNTFGTSAGVPHHVTLQGGTSLNFGANNFVHEMRGDMTINNLSTLALSTGFGGDLYIKGNWTRTATGLFNPNTRLVKFNGSGGIQTITRTGGGIETFAYMAIDKPTGQSLALSAAPNATNVTLNGFGGNNILQFTSGDLDLNQQTFNFTSWFAGNQNDLGIDGSAGNLTRTVSSTGGTGTFAIFNADAVTHTVTINRMSAAASLLVFATNVTVTTGAVGAGGGGVNFGNTLTTVNGTLQINSFGFVTGFAPTYGNNSFLVYNSSGLFDRNVEWGATSGPGYPWNVVVQNNTNIRLNTPAINGDADRAIAGNLSIVSGSSLLLSTTAANKLTVGGNVIMAGTLTLPTAIGGDLYIAGNFNRTASGVFTPNDRAVFFYGAGNSTITADGGELFPYLYITKNALANTVSLIDDISISKEFSVITGKFELAAKNATLKSDVSGTASFGQMGAAADVTYSGVGRFVVERYIPTGILGGQHGKSWQFLAVPDNGGQTINAGWQEGFTLPTIGISNYGTVISNATAGSGFDIIGGVGPSIKSFVPATSTWVGVPNTTIQPLFNKKGYFLFVRGDRNVSVWNATANTTTLRTTGKLFVPVSNPPQTTTVPAGQFESIGNPYASSIDFLNVTKSAAPDVDDVFYVWDPLLPGSYLLGGFQTISSVNSYIPSPGGTANYSNALPYTKIQSGQAFMVHSTGAAGTVSFTESAKVTGSDMLFRQASQERPGRQYLRSQLYTGDGIIADANVVAFDNRFNNSYEANDALKIKHAGENFDIESNGKILAIEARKPVMRMDTIQFNVSNLRMGNYQFRFAPEQLNVSGLVAWLEDRYLRTQTMLNLLDSSTVDFTINSDLGSTAANRFFIIFKKISRPVTMSPIVLSQKTENEKVKEDAEIQSSISVYPNPVVQDIVKISFINKAFGTYKLQLLNSAGQIVLAQTVAVAGVNESKAINVAQLPAGYYRVIVIAEDGAKTIESLVIE